MSVSVVARGTVQEIGEGPHWEESTQTLLYTDMWAGDAHRLNPVTGEDTQLHVGDDVSFIIPRARGGYVASRDRAIGVLDWTTGKFEELARVDQLRKDVRINDGKCDPAGRLWTGTMQALHTTSASFALDHVLYSLDTNHVLKSHKHNVGLSNGLAWTGDKKTMFYSDSVPRVVYAYDYDVTTGEMSNERTAVSLAKKPGDDPTVTGITDGISIDADDKLWVALFGAGKVVRFDPETGKELLTVSFPTASHTTSCCWGGPNLDELYVTCSRNPFGLTVPAEQSADAGCVFRVTGLGVRGRAAYTYAG